MVRTTQRIRDLAMDALARLPNHRDENIIESAFVIVESDDELRNRFECERRTHGRDTTNKMFGRYVRDAVGGVAIKQVDTTRTRLAGSYSKLRF